MFCSQCGMRVNDGAHFCDNCGAALQAPGGVSQVPPVKNSRGASKANDPYKEQISQLKLQIRQLKLDLKQINTEMGKFVRSITSRQLLCHVVDPGMSIKRSRTC